MYLIKEKTFQVLVYSYFSEENENIYVRKYTPGYIFLFILYF